MNQYFINFLLSFILIWLTMSKEPQISEDGEPSKISRTPMWQGMQTVRLEHLLSIGTDDLDKANYVFGVISDVKVDREGCIYVLDALNYRVQKFSPGGQFVLTLGKGKGKGPGEFLRPMSMAIDSQKNLYVADPKQRRITVFDSTGSVKATIPTTTMPAQIVVGKGGQIYITNFFHFDGPRVDKYTLTSKGPILSFCKPRKESKLIAESGNTENLAIDAQGNVYVIFHYPYDIRKFSANGRLLDRFSREAKFYTPPRLDENGVMVTFSGTRAATILPDGKLMAVIYSRDGSKFQFYFDVFEKDGTWLLSVPTTEFGMDWPRVVISDSKGYLYVDYSEPYPHLVKYRVTFANL